MEQDLMQERKEMGPVDQRQANQLLHNKFVVVLGDSIHRGIYKDIVVMLRKDGHVSSKQLKNKGEISFEQDCLVEGGQLGVMSNGTSYREVRQYRTEHHMIRFYFITKIFSRYMRSVLADFQRGLKPDLVILNSCLWDVSRYSGNWVMEYRENLKQFFTSLKATLPQESLVVWNMAMPLADKIVGGFLVPEIQHMEPMLRFDVIEANYYAATLANDFGFNVLDLHFQFRLSLQHRMPDGVHWNATAHRKITHLLLEHVAQAWGVTWSKPDETKERRPLLPSPVPFQGAFRNTRPLLPFPPVMPKLHYIAWRHVPCINQIDVFGPRTYYSNNTPPYWAPQFPVERFYRAAAPYRPVNNLVMRPRHRSRYNPYAPHQLYRY